MGINPLRVGDEGFLVRSMIERCPRSMMLRELVQNAIDAASSAAAGSQRVEIESAVIEGVRKLVIWNSGVGMDADELYRMCDIASSIGKINGLDQNFGMGAKVASLPSNRHGIRYRSCKEGRVHQVIMGQREGIYGRVPQIALSGRRVEILDVTDEAGALRPLSLDWTEVVALGDREDQNTFADPHDGAPAVSPDWIMEALSARFFRTPATVKILLKDGDVAGWRTFVPMALRANDFSRHEAVESADGITIHYMYKAAGLAFHSPDALVCCRPNPAQGSAGLVYRGEIYDVLSGAAWMRDAPIYGLPFGAAQISIYIELPDEYPLLPDGYRQFLRYGQNRQQHVQVRDFANLAHRQRPVWLLELLDRLVPGASHLEPVSTEMGGFLRALGVRRRWWPSSPPSAAPVVTESNTTSPTAETMEFEVAPEIVLLRHPQDIEHRGLTGKAARFYSETHQLFVNACYAAFGEFAAILSNDHAASEDQEDVRRSAQTLAEEALIRQICRKLIFALAKRDLWQAWEVEQATSSYSLTLAADDHAGLLEATRRALAVMLHGPGKIAVRLDRERDRLNAALERLSRAREAA